MANDTDVNLSREVVVALTAQLLAQGKVSIDYNLLSGYDGTRSADGWRWQFRSILKEARELNKRIEDGETFDPVPKGVAKKRGTSGDSAANTPKSSAKKPTKRGKATDDSEDEEPTPTKKKVTATRAKKMDKPVKEEAELEGNSTETYGRFTDSFFGDALADFE